MPAPLITLEGIDGSGKSTILRRLRHNLPRRVVFTKEPTGGPLGRLVRAGLARGHRIDPLAEALLFVADHAEHVALTLRPALEKGRPVISDRYSDSRYAYQSVTLRDIVSEPLQWLQELHRPITIAPQQTLLLVVDPREAISRMEGRRKTKFEREVFLRVVQLNYRKLALAEPWRFVVVDANRDLDKVAWDVEMEIRRTLKL
ncbi:MAG: dTMP kinase [Euryarchaeota archaeon]|nr:dTMP kinase [Euryarchaeota archaeon]